MLKILTAYRLHSLFSQPIIRPIIAVNSNMDTQFEEDGWVEGENSQEKIISEMPAQLRYHFKDKARDILDAQHHSLEPDMAMGWRPKLPSCPLPLSYANPYLDALLPQLSTDDRFKLVYLGGRASNSVQVNQQHQYHWRYRSRYNTTLTAVREAVQRVGENGRRIPLSPHPGELHFDSSFQSGNLDMAVRVKPREYDLFMRSDTNTRGHTSWYYFRVNNGNLLGEVQFNIANFCKKKNMYSHGMKPYVKTDNGEWSQEGCYQVCCVQRLCRYGFERKNHQVQFKYNFRQKDQNVYIAYAIPYTLTQLQQFIGDIKQNPNVTSSKLCESLGGLEVPLLTITNTPLNEATIDFNNVPAPKKKVVLIGGRIHPGETNASYVLQGLIRSLIANTPEGQALRNSFVFYIVPMINPDGVVAGNFRTSFSGKDLNRQFNRLSKSIFPEVTALHDLAMQLKRTYRSSFQFYFDFHAHSCKKGLFCYGPQHLMSKPQFFRSRALAKLIQQKTPIFSYRKSIFTIHEMKRSTGRAHMLWKVKVPMSFTFQVSNGLYETRQCRSVPFKASVLTQLGHGVLMGLYRYGQIEMKLPTLNVRAKVDTGIKRRLVSSKQFRKSNTRKDKSATLRDIQLKDRANSQSCREHKPTTLKVISQSEPMLQSDDPQSQEFMQLVKEIKREQLHEKISEDYEGGSDSESSGDDLSGEELQKLHKIIETRNQGHQKSYSRGFMQWKNNFTRKSVPKRQSNSEEVKQNRNVQIEFSKKPVLSKYLQNPKMSLPPRSRKLPCLQPEKMVLPPKYFALDL